MDYGRLSGRLHSHEDWLALDSEARELLVTVWSWAIDHEKESGLISPAAMDGLAASLGQAVGPVMGRPDSYEPPVLQLVDCGWLEVTDDGYVLARFWDATAQLIRAQSERRRREHERYLRRKAGG